jgi:small subunit ribosomal protein S21
MDKRNELPINGLKVAVHNNDIGRAMRKLKKKILEEGVMQELRDREFFQSKGTKRRLARLAAIRRYKKNQQRRED